VVQAESGVVISRRLAARFGTEWRTVNPTALDYSTRLILITEEMEQRLSGAHERRREHRGAAIRLGRALWWLSPQIAFQTALADLAGTGTARHELFLDAVRTFQLDLRAFMYPRVLEQVRFPSRRPCESCPGRLNFTAYDAIPRFSMPEPSSSSRAASGFGSAAWLALLAALMLVVGPGTTGTWKIGSD
jgi:hypothetical protein